MSEEVERCVNHDEKVRLVKRDASSVPADPTSINDDDDDDDNDSVVPLEEETTTRPGDAVVVVPLLASWLRQFETLQ